jgi:mannitol/fructose-specific phosphotransferase system IIA component (Ntr-type)
MKRKKRKHAASQLLLFEPNCRWSDLSLDSQQKALDQFAQLIAAVAQLASQDVIEPEPVSAEPKR